MRDERTLQPRRESSRRDSWVRAAPSRGRAFSGAGGAVLPNRARQPAEGKPQLMVGRDQVTSLLEELGMLDVAAAQPLGRSQRFEDTQCGPELGVDALMLAALGGDTAQPHVAFGERRLLGQRLGEIPGGGGQIFPFL